MSPPSWGSRSDYAHFLPITTRWMDNDLYGHVNNVTYYSWFDSAVNRYLIEAGGLDIHRGPIIGYVVSSQCNYYSAVAYPDAIEVGMRVDRLGNSSVTYGVAIFRQGHTDPCAEGQFVHVFVQRDTEKSTPIPDKLRSALAAIERSG